jgi:hypothetical protein
VQPNTWFSRGSIVESTHWMVLHRPVELAAETGQVEATEDLASRNDLSGFIGGQPRYFVF